MTTTVRFVPRLTTVRFPANGISTVQFAAMMLAYNALLPQFRSNSDAVLGVAPDGSPTTALGVGKEYIAAQGNTEVAQGTKMITYAL